MANSIEPSAPQSQPLPPPLPPLPRRMQDRFFNPRVVQLFGPRKTTTNSQIKWFFARTIILDILRGPAPGYPDLELIYLLFRSEMERDMILCHEGRILDGCRILILLAPYGNYRVNDRNTGFIHAGNTWDRGYAVSHAELRYEDPSHAWKNSSYFYHPPKPSPLLQSKWFAPPWASHPPPQETIEAQPEPIEANSQPLTDDDNTVTKTSENEPSPPKSTSEPDTNNAEARIPTGPRDMQVPEEQETKRWRKRHNKARWGARRSASLRENPPPKPLLNVAMHQNRIKRVKNADGSITYHRLGVTPYTYVEPAPISGDQGVMRPPFGYTPK